MPTLRPDGRRLNGRGSSWITRARRLAIYIRDRFACQYCGTDLSASNPREVTLDHLRPQCRDGTHASSNLVTACLACNSRRQNKKWWLYAPPGARARILRQRRLVLNLPLARAILAGEVTREVAIAEARSQPLHKPRPAV